jgi:site-specific recombinase XerD
MIDAMQVRGFSPRTHESYLWAVSALARYYRCSPADLSVDQIRAYFLYLVKERHLSDASCRLHLHGLRFLYLQVLEWPEFDVPIPHPKRSQRIPELLSRAEVARLLRTVSNLKHRTMLMICYGCGLRVSELMALQVRHIDGERRLLRVEQGKGAKDRLVPIATSLLVQLRDYWQRQRPQTDLFPNETRGRGLSISCAQRIYRRAKQCAGIQKQGGIHALRHAYATHQLEAGLPVHQLQHYLGHRHIQTTLRYVHWVPGLQQGDRRGTDLLADLDLDNG